MRAFTVSRAATLAAALLVATACSKKADDTTTQTSAGTIDTTAAANAVKVDDVNIGKAVGDDKQVTNKADEFKPNDTIYASIHTKGSSSNTSLGARWTFQDGQVVDERTTNIAPTGDTYTEFHITKPSGWPEGKYTLHVLLNGQEVQTKDFEVKK